MDSSIKKEISRDSASNIPYEVDSLKMTEMSRKKFLALIAASAAFAAAGCSEYHDKGEIVPYARMPEGITPGVPNYYASTCTCCNQACGILIKTREGRPVKIDGNPDHPINRGKICAKGQANILNLYDPFRLRAPRYGSAAGRGSELSWKNVDEETVRRLREAVRDGKEIAVITRHISSPTTKKVLDEFRASYPTTKIYSYSLFNNETRKRAWHRCYGLSDLPVIQWDKAKIILALEADFLGTDGMVMEQIRQFTAARDVMNSKSFNRLYCAESSVSLTGANADYRFRLRPDAQLDFVLALARELGGDKKIGGQSLREFASHHTLSTEVLNNLIDDLQKNRGESLIYAGDLLPEPVHIAVNYLNDMLGGSSLYVKNQRTADISALSPPDEIDVLIGRINAGKIGVLIHFDSNPVFHLPREFRYEDALKSVPFSIGMTEADNETSRLCTFVLPINNSLESWGDHKIRTGIASLQQPVIAPLYDSRQKEAVFLTWMTGDESYKETLYHDFLMDRWKKEIYPFFGLMVDFRSFWYSALHDGVIEFRESVDYKIRFKPDALAHISRNPSQGIVVVLTESYYLGDGSASNNGWLQELPHPVSKIIWDNYAALSVKTARELKLDINNLIDIRLPHGSAVLPVFIQPGHADNVISISLGYGRSNAGPVGTNVGVDLGRLLTKQSLTDTRVFEGAAVHRVEGRYDLVMTQELHNPEDMFSKDLHLKRKIIREGTVAEYRSDPDFLSKEKAELFSITKEVEYKGVKWAMAIDLNKCIGCSACVAGCIAENNVPVVGKEQAALGRTMHWIRIDRYYSGTDDAPSISYQPMLCQHCDNAPCENVCPVVATNHSPDGLNQMVYNRCVGTKYCSNNCPFKVRRFNFFNWRDDFRNGYYEQQPVGLVYNPEVTVRSRGVMEKCTFCIQRIMEERQNAMEQKRKLNDSNIHTACQDACPARAIEFGDMNNSNSRISEYRKHSLGYHVLEETNVRPNVTYIAKLKNLGDKI